jgi:hypothetical protein
LPVSLTARLDELVPDGQLEPHRQFAPPSDVNGQIEVAAADRQPRDGCMGECGYCGWYFEQSRPIDC